MQFIRDTKNTINVEVTQNDYGNRDYAIERQAQSNISSGAENSILTFTNTGTKLYIDTIGVEGSVRAEWFVYINTVLKKKFRSTTASPSIDIDMNGFSLDNGDIINVKAQHYAPSTQEFSTEVRYFRWAT